MGSIAWDVASRRSDTNSGPAGMVTQARGEAPTSFHLGDEIKSYPPGSTWLTRPNVSSWKSVDERAWTDARVAVEASESLRQESRQLEKIATTLTSRNQEESTRTLAERCRELESFRILLLREWQDMEEELRLLREEKRRLEKALLEFDVPGWLATECLHYRSCRPGVENTADFAETLLQQEKKLSARVQETLQRLIETVDEQLTLNSSAKAQLEVDWSQKLKANHVDRGSTFMPAAAAIPGLNPGTVSCLSNGMSNVEEWLKRSRSVIAVSNEERRRSRNLRITCMEMRKRASKDICTARQDAEDALAARITEIEEAKEHTSTELHLVMDEMSQARQSYVSCQMTERSLAPSMGLATTRLERSRKRPSYELCHDPPRERLKEEVGDCHGNMVDLRSMQDFTEEKATRLENSAMQLSKLALDHELALDIDSKLCLKVRGAYPSLVALSGYD